MVQISASLYLPVRSYECTKTDLIKTPYYNYIVQGFYHFGQSRDFGQKLNGTIWQTTIPSERASQVGQIEQIGVLSIQAVVCSRHKVSVSHI